jgi:hypothetical protein
MLMAQWSRERHRWFAALGRERQGQRASVQGRAFYWSKIPMVTAMTTPVAEITGARHLGEGGGRPPTAPFSDRDRAVRKAVLAAAPVVSRCSYRD